VLDVVPARTGIADESGFRVTRRVTYPGGTPLFGTAELGDEIGFVREGAIVTLTGATDMLTAIRVEVDSLTGWVPFETIGE
jgi:hypothetical protein